MRLKFAHGSAMIEIIKPDEKESFQLYINGRCLAAGLNEEEMNETLAKALTLTDKEIYIRQKIRDTCAILASTLEEDLLGDWNMGAILDDLSNLIQAASD